MSIGYLVFSHSTDLLKCPGYVHFRLPICSATSMTDVVSLIHADIYLFFCPNKVLLYMFVRLLACVLSGWRVAMTKRVLLNHLR